MEEVIEMVMNEEDDGGPPRVPDLHALQLMCFENAVVEAFPCLCHNYRLINARMSFFHCQSSEFRTKLWNDLRFETHLSGVYFVAYWAAAQFNPEQCTFFGTKVHGMRGVLLHVPEYDVFSFVGSIAAMAEAGVLPCLYLRKLYPLSGLHLLLYTDIWFGMVGDSLIRWQESEYKRLGI
ncbi:ORF22 [Pigeon adenovirus 2a]|nr:ORF22 [Pigeon adenovirus 2a]